MPRPHHQPADRAVRTAMDAPGVPVIDPDRVLVAGDTHGDASWLGVLCQKAGSCRCPVILQLGDFGFWSHTGAGERFLDDVDLHAAKANIVIWWIGGNHENWELLARYPVDDDGLVTLRSRIRHVPNETRWTWSGIRFGALGGAFSLDGWFRRSGIDWWPDLEQPTQADLAHLGDDRLEVLVCHDAPEGGINPVAHGVPGLPRVLTDRSRDTRVLLREAARRTRPQLIVHGHWHARHSSALVLDKTTIVPVEGFAHNRARDQRAWGVLSLPKLVLRQDGDPGLEHRTATTT